MEQRVKRGEHYRHFKGGIYGIEHVALCSGTQRPNVVYRAQSDGRVWVRPLEEFLGRVACPTCGHDRNACAVRRFVKIEENMLIRSAIEHTKRFVRCAIQFFAS